MSFEKAVFMFFLVALLATMAYSLQGVLLTSYFRRMDRLSVVAYRGLSLAITMLPLFLFVHGGDGTAVIHAAPYLVGAVVTAAVANWYSANAFSFLPIGIATALGTSFTAVVSVLLGYCVLGETLQAKQLGYIALVLAGVLLLGAMRSQGALPPEHNVARGLLHSVFAGLFLAASYVMVGVASRLIDPFLVGYLWESCIGILVAFVVWGRSALGGASLTPVSWREFGRILLCSSPTALGSALFPLATTLGPFAVATAILGSMMVFSTLLAMFLYRERLTVRQWCLMVFVCLMVAGLRLAS